MTIKDTLIRKGWFTKPGAYVLVDGQFGSTGKGLLASLLADVGAGRITDVTTNAGSNSGHTAYWRRPGADYDSSEFVLEKVMTQQIPVSSVFLKKAGHYARTYLNAGAVINKNILIGEMNKWGFTFHDLFVSERAAVINDDNRLKDMSVTDRIAGTGKGVGPAIADKVLRNTHAVVGPHPTWSAHPQLPEVMPQPMRGWSWNWDEDVVFVETAQGFSLGINSQFYPFVTSRECTVMQAISDARIPAQMVRKVVACFRTFPIRVGNTEKGNSGGWYPDQEEVTWDDIGVEPEITSVTKRVRRVATWSRMQFREAVAANRPDVIFLNFMNYIKGARLQMDFWHRMRDDYIAVMGKEWDMLLLGHGPQTNQIVGLSEVEHGQETV